MRPQKVKGFQGLPGSIKRRDGVSGEFQRISGEILEFSRNFQRIIGGCSFLGLNGVSWDFQRVGLNHTKTSGIFS